MACYKYPRIATYHFFKIISDFAILRSETNISLIKDLNEYFGLNFNFLLL